MLTAVIRAALSSFIGAISFGALMNAPKKSLPVGGAIGMLGYLIYWGFLRLGTADALSMFLGAFIAAAVAQIAARKLRMISTIFITMAIIPLVPGMGLYRAMSALGQGQTALGASIAVESMALILMIALGVAMGSALFGTRRAKGRHRA